MTVQHINPILAARSGEGGKFEPGTPEARQQLQDHCDRLNRMAGDRFWFVIKRDDKLTIDNGPRQREHGNSPPASKAEVAEIMRRHGLR